MKYELIIVWKPGEMEITQFDTREEAEKGAENMKMAFGKQIEWTGIREKRSTND